MRPSDAQLRPCRCGGRRQANKSVCFGCWSSAPVALRNEANAARTIEEQRAAMRQLLAHASTRNLQPELL